MSHMSH